MKGKIALEEHVSTEENNKGWDLRFEAAQHQKTIYGECRTQIVRRRGASSKEMDEFGIETAILSLTTPGAQSILDSNQAVDFAKRTNDRITEPIRPNPTRGDFMGFALWLCRTPGPRRTNWNAP